jgi:cytoskeletal protein CcmA (bactofilin family)
MRGIASGSEDGYSSHHAMASASIRMGEEIPIGPNGRVTADLKVRDLIVFGLVNGNVIASGRIELRQSAVINGDIVASRMSIEENATIKGRVELTGQPPKTAEARDE